MAEVSILGELLCTPLLCYTPFLVDGAQAQPTGDETFIRRVEAVPMRVMFEPKEVTDQPMDGIDVPSHAEIDHVVNYMRMGMHNRVAPKKGRAMVTCPH